MGKKSNAKKAKKEEIKKATPETLKKQERPLAQEQEDKSQTRIVILETDGNNVKIAQNTTSGNLELISMLQILLSNLTSPKQ